MGPGQEDPSTASWASGWLRPRDLCCCRRSEPRNASSCAVHSGPFQPTLASGSLPPPAPPLFRRNEEEMTQRRGRAHTEPCTPHTPSERLCTHTHSHALILLAATQKRHVPLLQNPRPHCQPHTRPSTSGVEGPSWRSGDATLRLTMALTPRVCALGI